MYPCPRSHDRDVKLAPLATNAIDTQLTSLKHPGGIGHHCPAQITVIFGVILNPPRQKAGPTRGRKDGEMQSNRGSRVMHHLETLGPGYWAPRPAEGCNSVGPEGHGSADSIWSAEGPPVSLRGRRHLVTSWQSTQQSCKGFIPPALWAAKKTASSNQGCPTSWHLWATLEEEELSWATR